MKIIKKIAIDKQGRGIFLEIEIREEIGEKETIDHQIVKKYKVLTISGFARKNRLSDYAYAGQIQDELNNKNVRRWLISKEKIKELLEIWDEYHLNDLTPGCIHQKIGNYEDPKIQNQVCPITGYKYGTKWLLRVLPNNIEQKLKEILS